MVMAVKPKSHLMKFHVEGDDIGLIIYLSPISQDDS